MSDDRTRVEAAKERADLRLLVPASLVSAETDRYLQVFCPFHDDRVASLLVFADGFKCQGCGARGDAVAWLRDYAGLSFEAALQNLESRGASASSSSVRPRRRRGEKPFDEAKVWFWHYSLDGDAVRYYESRGLTKRSVVDFRLGWGSRFPGECPRYVVPRFWRGRVSGVKFRRAYADDPVEAKYNAWPDLNHPLWTPDGGDTLLRLGTPESGVGRVVLTEGEFDAMVATQMGYYAVSPTGGAASVSKDWTDLLRFVPNLYLVPDNDPINEKTGKKPGEEFVVSVRHRLPRVRVLRLPDRYKDLSEAAADGWDGLHDLIEEADRDAERRRVRDLARRLSVWYDVQ